MHLCSPCQQKGWTPPWAHISSRHWREGTSWTWAASWESCCIATEALHQLGEFHPSSCVWLLAYLWVLCLVSPKTCQKQFCLIMSKNINHLQLYMHKPACTSSLVKVHYPSRHGHQAIWELKFNSSTIAGICKSVWVHESVLQQTPSWTSQGIRDAHAQQEALKLYWILRFCEHKCAYEPKEEGITGLR